MSQPLDRLVADNLDIWTGATLRKSGAGRGGSNRISLYGIERLRALILDLAVRGKLVSQHAEDEPAADLLKSINAERVKLVKAEAIGKGKSFAAVSDQPPFAVPMNWVWTQVSEIGHDWGQQEPTSDFTYIDVGSIDQTLGVVRSPNVVPASDAPSRARKVVRTGTVIYSTVRPYLLNIAIVDQDFDPEPIASTAFAIVHPFSGVEAGFIYRYFRSKSFVSYVESCQTGIAYPAINDRQFFAAWCPLPPRAEQRRIVAKVDELMALCDALERDSADAMAAHQMLVKELLATLVNSQRPADLAANWARLETHFDTLFTTEASIDALKQTILDLAVRGKLVEQDSDDGAAGKLLQKLEAERKALSATSRAGSKKKPRQSHIVEEELFPVPSSWVWTLVGELTETITSGSRDWSKFLSSNGAKFVTMGNLSRGSYELRLEKMHYVQIGDDREGARTSLRAGDLLVSITGDVGNMALIPEGFGEAYINQHTAMLRFLPSIRGRFVPELLRSPLAQNQFSEPQRGVKNSFRLSDIQNIRVPIPPLAEQHRIVAKVDALMALCDQLKARLADAAQTQRHLADAISQRAAA